MLTTVSNHQSCSQLTSEKEPVNLRESFESESSYELIQVLPRKKNKEC